MAASFGWRVGRGREQHVLGQSVGGVAAVPLLDLDADGPQPQVLRRPEGAAAPEERDQDDAAGREFMSRMRRELAALGALPADLPPDPEPLWSLMLFEAENDLS